MTALMQVDALLKLADKEAGRYAGQGRPPVMELRRAVSSAYYAVFHQITMHIANELLGDATWTQEHATVCRWVSHIDLKKLADAAALGPAPNRPVASVLGRVNPDLAELGQNYIDLQTARHDADYNDFAPVSKALSISWVDTAHRSVDLARGLRKKEDESYRRFLRLALGGVKIAKTR